MAKYDNLMGVLFKYEYEIYFCKRRRCFFFGQGHYSSGPRPSVKGPRLKNRHTKFDPYINIDPAGMSPFQHGEIYVTDDGAQCDLDGRTLRALYR
jgi:hypothetical protein